MTRAVGIMLLLSVSAAAAEQSPLMRYEAMIVLLPAASGQAEITLRSVGIAPYVTPLTWELIDADNVLLDYGVLAIDAEHVLRFDAVAGEPLLLRMDAGLNGHRVESGVPWAVVASEDHHLRFNRPERDTFVWVPRDAEAVELHVLCESPNEGAAVALLDPDGETAASVSGEIAEWETLRAEAPAAGVWRVSVTESPPTHVDDVDFYLTGGAVPLVSMRPEWAEEIARAMLAVEAEAQ